jgi:hypothetical protein
MQQRLAGFLIIPLIAIAIAGCSAFGASSGGAGGEGGGRPANPGGTFGGAPPPQPVNPGAGNPVIVTAQPGQTNLHPIHPYELSSRIDGTGHVIVRVRWWGGIEPCDVLDSVTVAREGATFTLTLQSGAPAGLNVACIEIARDTATLVDLGVLPSGTYSVRADPGDAPPLTLTVG